MASAVAARLAPQSAQLTMRERATDTPSPRCKIRRACRGVMCALPAGDGVHAQARVEELEQCLLEQSEVRQHPFWHRVLGLDCSATRGYPRGTAATVCCSMVAVPLREQRVMCQRVNTPLLVGGQRKLTFLSPKLTFLSPKLTFLSLGWWGSERSWMGNRRRGRGGRYL
jgi:hypothetical protein